MVAPLTFFSERGGMLSKRAAQSTNGGSTSAMDSTSTGTTTTTIAATTNYTTSPGLSTGLHGNHTLSTFLTTNVTAAHHQGHDKSSLVTAVGVTASVLCTLALVAGIVYLMKRIGMLQCIFGPASRAKRRSSTSGSTRPLDLDLGEHEGGSHVPDGRVRSDHDHDDLFTIDDMDDGDYVFGGGGDGDGNGSARDHDAEGYFYDEVYGPSQFEDETTSYSVRQLVNEGRDRGGSGGRGSGGSSGGGGGGGGGGGDGYFEDDNELLDFDFETLGIKITDKMDLPRRNTSA